MTRGVNHVIENAGGVVRIDVSTSKHPGASTLIDAADASKVLDGGPRWRASLYRNVLYVQRTIRVDGRKQSQLLHRVVCRGLSPEQVADHRNMDTLDNRSQNLRPASQSQNSMNGRLRHGTSAYRGVSWHTKQGLWRVVAYGKHVGYFDTQEEAARAYDAAVENDPFARLNFPKVAA